LRKNAELTGELAEKEKAQAQLELELRSLHLRHDQLVNTANEARRDVTDDHLNNAATQQDSERLQALEDILAKEKQSRDRFYKTLIWPKSFSDKFLSSYFISLSTQK
jgi:hypothetical protein